MNGENKPESVDLKTKIGIQTFGFFLEDRPGAIFGAVVDEDDFLWDSAEVQLKMKMLDGRRDAAFLVARGNDDGEQAQ